MKKHRRALWRAGICAGLAAVIAAGAFLFFGARDECTPELSAGLQHLADRNYLAASAGKGEEITFDAAFFDGALQGAAVSAITVTALPSVTAGELLLGQGEVSVGQRIDRENLSYLRYIPLDGADKASFSFVPRTGAGDCPYALECQLLSLDRANCCPVPSGSVSAVSTHATLGVTGTLAAEDPEGDALYFEVTEYPTGGTLSLDAETGDFCYRPTGNFHGEDSFTWRVQDMYGAYAEPCEVKITVRELATGYLYSDIEDGNRHTCALTVSEKGLLTGEKVGGKHYFHPERALSRAAFVTILLEAAEIKVPDAEDTGYTDNADIPRGMRGAIKYAKEQGWLGEDTVFRSRDAVTRAEAAAIAAKVLQLSAPGYGDAVKDHARIPVSVVDALYAAYEGGYLATSAGGELLHAEVLTRGDAAVFFARVLEKN
jgi:hypothetical protein